VIFLSNLRCKILLPSVNVFSYWHVQEDHFFSIPARSYSCSNFIRAVVILENIMLQHPGDSDLYWRRDDPVETYFLVALRCVEMVTSALLQVVAAAATGMLIR